MPSFVMPLASGSLGNALLLASNGTRVLIDMGLSQRRLKAGLAAAATAPEEVGAVFLTHTHRDHVSAAAVGFCLAHGTPLHSSRENLEHLAAAMPGFARLVRAGLAVPVDGEPVDVGDVRVEAFDVPHDAAGRPLGFRVSLGPARARRAVAVATDLGHVPGDALAAFIDATAVVIESNHDPEMLWQSRRPPDLIERIAGPHGHLSNGAAAEALAEIVGRSHPGRVREVVLAHLSRDCNTPRLALEAQAHLARTQAGRVRFTAATQYDAGPRIAL